MNRPRDRRLIRSPRRFSGQAVRWLAISCLIIACGKWSALAEPQNPLPENNSTRSISGEFIILPPPKPSSPNNSLRLTASTNYVRLQPALLAVSAERIKDLVWRKLDIKGPCRGQIYLVLHRAQSPDEAVKILSQPAASGWSYRVELPDVVLKTRFVRALTGVVLLEFANRNALARSSEFPAWLADGLSQDLLADGSPEILLSPPEKVVDGLTVTRLEKTRRGIDPLANTRRVLKNHPALTFEALSWPTGAQLDGDDDGVYRASAQLFTSEVLDLKNGPARLRTMLESMPRYYNWQVSFRAAFHEEFPTPLDLEKWWALTVVNFAAHDPGPGWTLLSSQRKLDEILRVPAELRTTSNSLPAYTEISLQTVIRSLEPARQTPVLRTKLRDLDLAQLRVARPYAVVTAEYRQTIGNYLGDRPHNAPAPSWLTRMYRSLREPSASATITRLDALDAERRRIAATARPIPSAQPSLKPLKLN
jgi:hypothetical protein